jgi:hypothetical protein
MNEKYTIEHTFISLFHLLKQEGYTNPPPPPTLKKKRVVFFFTIFLFMKWKRKLSYP